jgi:hypothetical protein
MISLVTVFYLLFAVVSLTGCSAHSGSQLTTPDDTPLQVEGVQSTINNELPIGRNPSQEARLGNTLFQNHCAGCHPGGGNRQNPAKPVLESAYLGSLKSFTQYLRNPGPGMPVFSTSDLPDTQANLIYQALHLASNNHPISKD